MRLAEKTAVVSGAGSGLGREGALLLAREGAGVLVMDRVPGRAADVAKQITGAGGIAQHFDGVVGDQADMAGAVDLGLERFGDWASCGLVPFSSPLEDWVLLGVHEVESAARQLVASSESAASLG